MNQAAIDRIDKADAAVVKAAIEACAVIAKSNGTIAAALLPKKP